MKRKQVLNIDPISSVLVVENEALPAEEGGSPSGVNETYVMRRFNVATWDADSVQDAVDSYDRIIDMEPPVRHLLRHHSVITQRGHINLVVSHCPNGSVTQLCTRLRAKRLSGVAGASRHHEACVPPADVRAWFQQAATAVSDLHSAGMAHGNPRLSALLCAETALETSEENSPNALLSAPIPASHVADRIRLAREKAPAQLATIAPPEIVEGAPVTFAADVWMLGDLMLDLIHLTSLASPFAPDDLNTITPATKARTIGNDDFRKYVAAMMHRDPSRRPTINEVIAAAPLLNWVAAIADASPDGGGGGAAGDGSVQRSSGRVRSGSSPRPSVSSLRSPASARRSESAGRAASMQPASPVRNATPPRPTAGFPVTTPDGSTTPRASKRAAPSASPQQSVEAASIDTEPAARASPAPRDPQDRPANTNDGWQQRAEMQFEELEKLNRRAHHHHDGTAGTPRTAGQRRRPAPVPSKVESIELDTSTPAFASATPPSGTDDEPPARRPTVTTDAHRRPPPQQQQQGGPTSRGAPTTTAQRRTNSSGPSARGRQVGGGVPAAAGGGAAAAPRNYQEMRTMTKADKMRALDERARIQHLRAAEYERARVAQQDADRAKQIETDERLRQHKLHMREIRTGKRPNTVGGAAKAGGAATARTKRTSPPSVEIFVQTPKRAGVKSFSSADFDDASDERRSYQPNADVAMGAREADGNGAMQFFVPLVTTGGQRRAHSADSPPSRSSRHRASSSRDDHKDPSHARSSALFTASSINRDSHVRDDMEPSPDAREDDDVPTTPPPMSSSSSSSSSDAASEEGGDFDRRHGNSDVRARRGEDTSPMQTASGSVQYEGVSPNPITPSRAPQPVARAQADLLMSTALPQSAAPTPASQQQQQQLPSTHRVARQWRPEGSSDVEGSPVAATQQSSPAAAMSEPPRQTTERRVPPVAPQDHAPATRPSAVDRDGDLSLGIAGATAVALAGAVVAEQRPSRDEPKHTPPAVPAAAPNVAPKDTHPDSGLVSVVEWNVDLIVRQLKRYMDDSVLHRVRRLCKAFATGPTETRTNPRANVSLMAKLGSMINDPVAFTECSPLLSQLVALQATLATAEHLRAVESFDESHLDGVGDDDDPYE